MPEPRKLAVGLLASLSGYKDIETEEPARGQNQRDGVEVSARALDELRAGAVRGALATVTCGCHSLQHLSQRERSVRHA
jgi:hypothetical protein